MKVWAYVILATLLIGAIGGAVKWIYDAGYDKAIAEQKDQAILDQNKAIADAKREWEETREAAEAQIVVEEKIVEVIREVEREVPRIVEKIVEVKPECRDLGPDYAGLLNAAVRASNGDGNAGTAAPAELVEGMP